MIRLVIFDKPKGDLYEDAGGRRGGKTQNGIICRVMEWLGKDADISRVHFLDWSLDNGYAGRCFAHMGAAWSAAVTEDAADKRLVGILNRLIYKPYCVLIHAPTEAVAAIQD